ncbi:MAG: NUDIX hydrolase [Candidatus Hydrogenedentes bacterium]|nr:NUDIX hydrolase [Candidatus Hydrogenedentota bacterium]
MKILGEGRFVRLLENDGYEYAERKGCTGIISVVAVTDRNELIFVEQFRPALGSRTIELVAGLAGDEGPESLEEAARRELLEEAGYAASSLELLFVGPSAGGISTSRVHFYLAQGATKAHEGGGVEGEDITVHVIPRAEAYAWLQSRARSETLVDPKVFLGIAVAHLGWNGATQPVR